MATRSDREYPGHPLVGVGGILRDGGKILLVKRKFEPNKGRWAFPGGLLEVGETLAEAAEREVKEELGLNVKVDGQIDVLDEIVRDGEGRVRYHFILVDFAVTSLGGAITLNHESAEYGWFEPKEVEGLEASANTKALARKLGSKV